MEPKICGINLCTQRHSLSQLTFREIPYSWFCLRGPNLCELCELADFNSEVTFALSFQLTATCHSSMLVMSLSYVSV